MDTEERKLLQEFLEKLDECIRRIERMEVKIEEGQRNIAKNLGETRGKLESHVDDFEKFRDKAFVPVKEKVNEHSYKIGLVTWLSGVLTTAVIGGIVTFLVSILS